MKLFFENYISFLHYSELKMAENIANLTAKTLTLHWHEDSRPIYTVDTQKNSNRLATGGGDNNVRIWRYVKDPDNGEISSIEYLSSISKHTQAINCVRFNPTGELLATSSDDGTIMIWERSDQIVKEFGQDDDEDVKESWIIKVACFSNSMSEIYDICWSPDSKYICCGLMDNIIRIFNTKTGSMIKQIAEHNHYVQGVTWDPLGEYICSQSVDRSVHVYKIHKSENGDFNVGPTAFFKSIKSDVLKSGQVLHDQLELTRENLDKNDSHNMDNNNNNNIGGENLLSPSPMFRTNSNQTTMEPPNQTPRHKRTYSNSSTTSSHSIFNRGTSPLPAVMPSSPSFKHLVIDPPIKQKQHYLYHGEGLQSFFRRLTFSPDGSLLLATSGMFKSINNEGIEISTNTIYVYTRGGINKPPIVHIPGLKKPAIGVRFSPIKYELIKSDDGISDVFNLPYRMIFAIATQDTILIYDTQRLKCLGIASNLHYAIITDLTWCKDGKNLFISSSDGFISTISLSDELLGKPIGDFDDIVNSINDLLPIKKTSPSIPNLIQTVASPSDSIPSIVISNDDEKKSGVEKRSILDMLGSTPTESSTSTSATSTSTIAVKKQHL